MLERSVALRTILFARSWRPPTLFLVIVGYLVSLVLQQFSGDFLMR